MKKRKARKWLSVLLCIVLAFSMFPVATSAAEGDVEYLYCDENGENWQTGIKADGEYTLVTSSETSWSDGWYVVNSDVTVSSRITVSGTVHLILVDGYTLIASNGIRVLDTNTLTIYGQANSTGKLVANDNSWNAAIGGDASCTGGSITINGGIVIATVPGVNGDPAAIGGGSYGDFGTIKINGGNVSASGCGKGIGGGANSTTGTIEISGGFVEANGIGTGNYGENHETNITGGVIVSTGSINRSHEDSWCGVAFESGNIIGNNILNENIKIACGQTLTISDGQTLIISNGVTLTNYGTIIIEEGGTLVNNGTIINGGTFTNNGTYTGNAPKCSATYLDADGIEKTAICDAILTADNIGEYTTINSGWYVVQGAVSTDTRITVSGEVHLILADGCEFNATSGILVSSGNSFTIYGQSLGTGKLIATAWTDGGDAGIGGVHHSTAGSITVNGGNIEATGYNGGAGIGGGHAGAPQSVTINGGNVIANGGACSGNGSGAGIGCGYATSGGTVKINGGTVVANGNGKSNQNAPGIGGGSSISSDNTTVIINGGVVTATCLDNSVSGIGGNFSTGTDGNAVIFTNSISDQSGKIAGTWSGVIFENSDGKVYGSAITPTEDFTIESRKSLLIPTGSTLTISGITAVNNGSVYVDGILSGSFSGTGSIYYPLTVTSGTASPVTVNDSKTYAKEGEDITLTATDVPVGQAVSGWTASDSAVTVENNAFTMPAQALTVSLDGYVNAPTYTVTIPATVEIGEDITISATGVNVVSGSQLSVKLSGTSEADNTFKLKTDEGAELSYGITKDSTALTMGSTVLTVAGGTADNSGTANLSFVKQGSEAYAGTYKGTVTFTVSVEEVISP